MFRPLKSCAAGIAVLANANANANANAVEAPTDSMTAPPAADVIVVDGVRVPTPIAEVGRSVTVIDAEAIEIRQQRFLYDALQAAPGVQVIRSGSFGGLSSVSIRGLPSDQTLLVQDGIVANNPAFFGNTFDFANFDAADIAQVEVLRGAQSTLYGSDAIAGVINVVTRDGRDGFGLDAFVEGGSFGTARGAATLTAGDETASGRLTVTGVRTGGFSAADEANGNTEDDGYRNITLSTKLRARPIDSFELEGVARYADSANEFDGFPPPAFSLADTDDEGDARDLSLAGSATHFAFDGRLENRVRITYYDSAIENRSGGFVTFDADGSRLSYDYQATVRPIDAVTFAGGFEFERERANTNSTLTTLSISTTSGFALAQARPTDWITLDAGLRVDNNSAFGSETTFSGSGSVRIPGSPFRIFGSYAEGFQAPSSGELNFNLAQTATFAFDPSLNLTPEAERSRGFDVGAEYRSGDGRFLLQAVYFNQQVDDLLTFLFVAGAPNFGVFANLDEFDTEGIEVSIAAQAASWLSVEGAYAYVDATNVSTSVIAGNQPDHRVNAQVRATPTDRLTLSAGISYNGRERSGATTLEPFTLVDFRAEYQANKTFAVFGRVENALDTDYQDNLGYGTAPAAWYIGVRARI